MAPVSTRSALGATVVVEAPTWVAKPGITAITKAMTAAAAMAETVLSILRPLSLCLGHPARTEDLTCGNGGRFKPGRERRKFFADSRPSRPNGWSKALAGFR